MICDLASLLGPVTEEIFFAHLLEKERLHVEAGQPDRAKTLLPWTTINRLVDADMLPPDRIRVMRASIDIAPKMYRHQRGARRLRVGALQALLTQGASLVINEIGELVPQIGRLADTLDRRLGHHIAIRAFVSFGQGGALKAHWDDTDVLVLQVHGRKLWRSYGSPTPLPISGLTEVQPVTKGVVWQGVLEPGDILYLPRGEVHEAALEGSNSVHLTIGIGARRGVDFVRWLSKRAAAELAFREDITRLGGEATLRRQEALLRERLHALIDAYSLADYLDADDLERPPRPLLSLGHDDELDEDTLVVPALRRRIPLMTDTWDEQSVVVGGEQHRLSGGARRILALLLARNGLLFGELARTLVADFSREEARAAVVDLARKGLVGLEKQIGEDR